MPAAFAQLDYVFERELGSGGIATVYRAHAARHNRQVAVTVMRAEVAARIGGDRSHRT
jgi:hypothetical protein